MSACTQRFPDWARWKDNRLDLGAERLTSSDLRRGRLEFEGGRSVEPLRGQEVALPTASKSATGRYFQRLG